MSFNAWIWISRLIGRLLLSPPPCSCYTTVYIYHLKVITALMPSSLPLPPPFSIDCLAAAFFLPLLLYAPSAISVHFCNPVEIWKHIFSFFVFNPLSTVLIMTKQRHINISSTHGKHEHKKSRNREGEETDEPQAKKWGEKIYNRVWMKKYMDRQRIGH